MDFMRNEKVRKATRMFICGGLCVKQSIKMLAYTGYNCYFFGLRLRLGGPIYASKSSRERV